MRKLLLAAVGAMALAGGATGASAAVVVDSATAPASLATLTPPTSFGITAALSGGPGAFSNSYDFTILGTSAMFTGQVSSVEGASTTHNINFTAPTLTQGATTLATFMLTSTDPNPETWAVLPANAVLLAPGTYTVNIGGMLNSTNGSYGGNFNLDAVRSVPEPATWAMMLLGFGAMGMVVRRRRKPVLAQLA